MAFCMVVLIAFLFTGAAYGEQVYLSLGSTIITTNNTKILITDIGVDAPFGGLPSLTCHTDLRACCRNSDTGGQGGRGAWYYPDGREVQNFAGSTAAGDGFYKVRNAPRVIRLARRTKSAPVGSYCCVIPTTKGVETFCALLTMDCGDLTPPTNGYVDTPSGTTYPGVALYSCEVGFELNGSMYRTCEASGIWAPHSTPTCQTVDCGQLNDPNKGYVNTSGTTYNHVATYSCMEGYQLQGPSVRTCIASGHWSPNFAPTCSPISCGPPPVLENGRVDTSQGTFLNNFAYYSCDPGYNLTGCSNARCLSTGQWSCDSPFCADYVMIQLKFGPTKHCVEWTEAEVEQMYKLMYSLIIGVIQNNGIRISRESIQRGYFSCHQSTTEATYRTTITGTERVSAVECTDVIQQWVESGVTTRLQWYVINFDKNCPVSINLMNDEECVNVV